MIVRVTKFKTYLSIMLFALLLSFQLRLPEAQASNSSGNEKLEIVSSDGQDINISNMAPGDVHTKTYTLKNKLSNNMDVLMNLRKIGFSKSDLFHQLNLTVIYDGKEIYHGVMSGFRATKLEQIPGNSEKELEIIQELPWEETGNEFQESTLESEFIFKLEDTSEDLPVITTNANSIHDSGSSSTISNSILPKTGSDSHINFWVGGSVFILIGVFFRYKKR